MERLGVGRLRCPNNGNDHRYLHSLSPQSLSHIPERDLNLFFLPSDTYLSVTSCHGLLCFNTYDDRTVLCNLATQQLLFLPPPPPPTASGLLKRYVTPYSAKVNAPRLFSRDMNSFGFGYDSSSDDYKVIRNYYLFSSTLHDSGARIFQDVFTKFELYSLRLNSWREIPTPYPWPSISSTSPSAFANGRVHWIASFDDISKVLAFDFATEDFYLWLLPPNPPDTLAYLVNIDDDSLGVVLCSKNGARKIFALWVWRQGQWTRLYDEVILYNVERPLGFKDGRLFLGRKSSNELEQVLVYDWINKELKELDIYDHSGKMIIISYVESGVVLPNSMPIGCYDDEASWNEYWRRCEEEVNEPAGV